MDSYSIEKYLTLSSKDSLNFYPDNQPNDFWIKLHEKISVPVGFYRLGLASISLQRSAKLFNPLFGDDIAQVIPANNQPLYTYTIEKKSSSLDDSLQEFNDSQTFVTIQISTDD